MQVTEFQTYPKISYNWKYESGRERGGELTLIEKKSVILVVEPLRSGYPSPPRAQWFKPTFFLQFLSLRNSLKWIGNAEFLLKSKLRLYIFKYLAKNVFANIYFCQRRVLICRTSDPARAVGAASQ